MESRKFEAKHATFARVGLMHAAGHAVRHNPRRHRALIDQRSINARSGSVKRELAAINYRIHTDAIKLNLIPPTLTKKQITLVYASEADVLNMALFGMTAKEWRDQNQDKTGNMRDYANIAQLICLSNLENLNAMFISQGETQAERLRKLNRIAIDQMRILSDNSGVKRLAGTSK